jgi:hypothetical protein
MVKEESYLWPVTGGLKWRLEAGWMDGWMDRWMDGWMDGWMDRWTDK